MGEKQTPDVRVGDVWADDDKRLRAPRMLRVASLTEQVAHCEGLGPRQRKSTRIHLDRFRPNGTGYRLTERGGVRIGDVWRLGDNPASDGRVFVLCGDQAKLQQATEMVTVPLAWILKGHLVERDGKRATSAVGSFGTREDCGGNDPKCLRCDGTGEICDVCGESRAACHCEEEG